MDELISKDKLRQEALNIGGHLYSDWDTGGDWRVTHEGECMCNMGIDKIKFTAKNRKEFP